MKEKSLVQNKESHLSSHRIYGVILATFFWYHAKQTEGNLAVGHELCLLAESMYPSPFKETLAQEPMFAVAPFTNMV